VEVFGTLYGFLCVVVAALCLNVTVWLLVKGKARAKVMGNSVSLGQEDGGEAEPYNLEEELSALRLGVLELQVRDPNLHITRRARFYDEYTKRGGNGDLRIYYNAVLKPLLEEYYVDQGSEGA
jgi:hypothetical protein